MDPLDERMGRERVGLARRRATAADVDRHRHRRVGDNDRDPRPPARRGRGRPKAGDVGEAVAFIGHCATVPQEEPRRHPVP